MDGMDKMMDLSFYKGKTVFITGHTGFKGSWMCKVLKSLGANVVGYALPPPSQPNLFEIAKISVDITSINGDVRDLDRLKVSINKCKPDIAIHMAAQPLVRESYKNPVDTYAVNVMGTVNFLESALHCDSIKSIINVTTDKVYLNNEWDWGYRESDRLDGYDPYSNSKSCSELVTSAYKRSFFFDKSVAVSTCRAGNVIGGGDFANDRIIPDCIRAMEQKTEIRIRNPHSIRPYQHVLEPVCAYLMIAQNQYENISLNDSYNIGPKDDDCVSTGTLVDIFCKKWGTGAKWQDLSQVNAVHEANFLKLDCSKLKRVFNWSPRYNISDAIEKTIEWSKVYLSGADTNLVMQKQINEYLKQV